mmetsp:Transcript_383/g.357  ORF Transcript_383/g.357 Transcript_383/m.357 type:complete len:125 (-) Transcript_383:425-799(-)
MDTRNIGKVYIKEETSNQKNYKNYLCLSKQFLSPKIANSKTPKQGRMFKTPSYNNRIKKIQEYIEKKRYSEKEKFLNILNKTEVKNDISPRVYLEGKRSNKSNSRDKSTGKSRNMYSKGQRKFK